MSKHARVICFALLIPSLTGARVSKQTLNLWQEHTNPSRFGGVYVSSKIIGEMPGKDLTIDLYDDESRQVFRLRHNTSKNKSKVNEIYRIPPGFYRLARLTYGERSWTDFRHGKMIVVRKGELANLGIVNIKMGKERKLSFSIDREKTKYSFEQNPDSPFNNVTDAYNGKAQESKPGHLVGGLRSRGPGGTYLASYSYYRNISLTYNVRVNRRRVARPILAQIDSNRAAYQQCYTDRIEDDRSGKVKLKIKSESKHQAHTEVELLHSELKHPGLETCLSNQLSGISIPSRKGLTGTVTFNFRSGQNHL